MTTEQKIDRIDNNVSMLIDQVGRMTEGITELRLVVTDGFTEFKESMARMEANLTKIEANQAQIGANLTRINESLDKLMQVTAEQAKTAAKQAKTSAEQAKTATEQTANITRLTLIAESQAATVDHLAKMVGQFLRDRQEP